MRIKIISAWSPGAWGENHIGEIFEVIEQGAITYKLENKKYIYIKGCITILDKKEYPTLISGYIK